MEKATTERDTRKLAMGVSLLVSFLMLIGKGTAYLLTGSEAIYSDAAESIIHLLSTAFVGYSLWYAVQPPDQNHPYGHGKIAYFSSGFEGGLILVAAGTILYGAIRSFIEGPQVQHLGTGLLIIAGLTMVNLGLGLWLVRVGRRTHSVVLISNGQHVLTDMWTSVGVLVGVGLVYVSGWQWLDPLVAIGVSINIAWMGVRLVRRSVGGLMEEVDGEETKAILASLDEAVAESTIFGYHQVRHRRVNDQIWIEYHLHFPGSLTVTEAHERSHAVEDAVAERFGEVTVFVTAHLEPDIPEPVTPHANTEPPDPLTRNDFAS